MERSNPKVLLRNHGFKMERRRKTMAAPGKSHFRYGCRRYSDRCLCSHGGFLCLCHDDSTDVAQHYLWPLLCHWSHFLRYSRLDHRHVFHKEKLPAPGFLKTYSFQQSRTLAFGNEPFMVLFYFYRKPDSFLRCRASPFDGLLGEVHGRVCSLLLKDGLGF